MCGVFGYVGQTTDVGAAILTALKTLEYRGYDSWGLAVATTDGLIVDKDVGRINGHARTYPLAALGVGHTRWATHGGVTAVNAHPHLDCSGRVAVVHNGIIENHADLRADLIARGHRFVSATDSEVVAHLLEEALAAGADLADAAARAFDRLEGYNAVVILDRQQERFVVAKRVSPLVIGVGAAGVSVASDAIALRDHADILIYPADHEIALLSAEGVEVLDRASLRPSAAFSVALDPQVADTGRGGYPDFLSKEVAEQPATLRRLVRETREEIKALAAAIAGARRVVLVGCGTAANAALAGAYRFAEICGRDIAAIPASEFRYRVGAIDSGTLVIAISQSGETIDVLEAMLDARERGARLAAVVNTPHSSLDRLVDLRVHLRAGVEQCVLATKSYTAQLAVLTLTACLLDGSWQRGADAVLRAASGIESILERESVARIRDFGNRLAAAEHCFVVGRGVHYPSALEAALKIKEVSYVHAEGFAGGELKHGVIALVVPGTPCLVFAPEDITRTDALSGAAELKSRGGYVIGIGDQDDPVYDAWIPVPAAGLGTPLVEAVPGQLLGYFAALARGNDPDRPRNLAKSVTVK
jgi:glucosamine--fructose-6-phosphate aminotransferase (isomerizing)